MKNLYSIITVVFISGSLFLFGQENESIKAQKTQGKYVGLSTPVRDLPQIHDESSMIYYNDEAQVRKNRVRPSYVDSTALPIQYDPLMKGKGMAVKMHGEVNLLQNFEIGRAHV